MMATNSLLTSSVLLAIITFSLAVDTPRSSSTEEISNTNSKEKVATLHQLSQLSTKDNLKLLKKIADDIKYEFFDEKNGNDTLRSEIESTPRRDNKKEDKMMHSLYMAMMMSKSFFGIVFMFINQIFQLKNFGFSLLNAIINIGRFIIQYQQHVTAQQKNQVVKVQAQDWAGSTSYGYGSGYQYYNPSSYSGSQAGAAADRVTRLTGSNGGSNSGNNNNNNLHANNLAYSAYVGTNSGGRT